MLIVTPPASDRDEEVRPNLHGARGENRATAKNLVLIVEDEVLLGMHLSEVLTEADCEVLGIAVSASQALSLVRQRVPDVAILDVSLRGDVDGINLARTLRDQFGVSVIFLTAHSDAATKQRADELHPVAFIRKPYSEAVVVEAVRKAITCGPQ